MHTLGAGSDAIAFENRYRCKDGSYKWLVWNSTMSPDRNMVYAIAHDITDRKQTEAVLRESEARFRSLAASSPIGIFLNDVTGACVYTNPRWQEITGKTLEESLGWGGMQAVASEDREAVLAEWHACVEEGREFSREFRCIRSAEDVRWVRSRAAAVRSATGLVSGYVGTIEDITERKRMEMQLRRQTQELIQANRELTDSNKELDDFAYIASHDLKEPLRGLNNYAVFLLEDYGKAFDDEGRAKLETLPRLAQRMEALIDSLLHYSRVGRVDLAFGEADLGQIVAEVCESLAISLQEAGIEIRIPTPLPTIWCDNARVGEIFRNLITNAMKYNDKPQKWIEIGVGAAADGRGPGTTNGGAAPPALASRVFYVRDNGIGIREKHHEAVFRIFKRLHGRDKYQGGTGAGLTIVKKIVERHGGRIWLASTPGEGSTFYFTLEREGRNTNASCDIESIHPPC
jgi:PAS domain S-box-containing protein